MTAASWLVTCTRSTRVPGSFSPVADQPTVAGYNPLFEMFWDPGLWSTPAHDRLVLLLSWLVTTLFCHFLLFAFEKARQRDYKS